MCCFYLFFLHNLKEISTQSNSISEHPNQSPEGFSFCFWGALGTSCCPTGLTLNLRRPEWDQTNAIMWCNYFFSSLFIMELEQDFKISVPSKIWVKILKKEMNCKVLYACFYRGLHLEYILLDDGMQTKWFIMLGIKYAELSVLNVVAGTALYQFKRQNL